MNCPNCNTGDYYSGIFGGNCINSGCSLYKNGTIRGEKIEEVKNFNNASKINWAKIPTYNKGHTTWRINKETVLMVWRRTDHSCLEMRVFAVDYRAEDLYDDLPEMISEQMSAIPSKLIIARSDNTEEVLNLAAMLMKHFCIDPYSGGEYDSV